MAISCVSAKPKSENNYQFFWRKIPLKVLHVFWDYFPKADNGLLELRMMRIVKFKNEFLPKSNHCVGLHDST